MKRFIGQTKSEIRNYGNERKHRGNEKQGKDMLEDVDKKLDGLLQGNNKEEKASSLTKQDILDKLDEKTALLIFKKSDGSLVFTPTEIFNKELLISLAANAILFALLITKTIGLW